MKMEYIGAITGGKAVRIARDSPNQHMVISGISGSGKSTRIEEIEWDIIQNKGTVIALDLNGTQGGSGVKYNHISAQEDGLNIDFLDLALVNEGKETLMNFQQYVMETICPRQLRGACQLAAVRRAIEFAVEHRGEFPSDMEGIAQGLKEQDESAALGAYNHLCSILEGDIFRNSKKEILTERINVISLKGLNPKTQKRVIEIFLSVMWRRMRISGQCKDQFTLVLDEFQNLDFYPGSVLFQMLTEARKYGVNLILATQTLTIFSKKELAIINQAATKLFFQQSSTDLKKVADLIEPGHSDKWISKLLQLRLGQAIAVGELEIRGRKLQQPIITNSMYLKGSIQNNVPVIERR